MLKSLQQWKMWQTIKQHRDSKTLIMGVSWYRPEQWERLREISEDKATFDTSYEESLVEWEKKIQDLEAQGMHLTLRAMPCMHGRVRYGTRQEDAVYTTHGKRQESRQCP